MMSQKLSILFVGLFFYQFSFAQLSVTGGNTAPYTPENLISNVFLGEGVEVTNITYSGDEKSVGYFSNGDSFGLGIERGVLLTSGFAASSGGENGADNTGGTFAGNNSNSGANDADLNTIATGTVNDLCKYSISFIPTSDTLRFEYIFASEEYPEFSCSFNDVFSFIISGPGITGPFENQGMNIAVVPGTNLPVTIDNVRPQNPGNAACTPLNEQYYNNNNNSNNHPVYDGYLDVFIAQAVVMPCEEYTIKLMIADVGDSAFDSGVFLAAKSFGTGSIDVETATVSLDGTITEGCATGVLSFKLPNAPEDDLALDYTIFGSAINGVDYATVPLDLTFPAGVDSIGYEINAFEDGIPEGVEFIGIDIQRDICNRDTFYFYIKDTQIVPAELNNDTIICGGLSVELFGELPIVLPDPPSFTSTNDIFIDTSRTPFYSNVQVFGVEPFILQNGVIQSICINLDHSYVGDMDVYVISPSGQFIELTTDNGGSGDNYEQTCFTPTAITPIVPPGALSAPNSAAPFTGEWIPEGIWSDLWDGDNETNGTWQLLMIDDGQGIDTGHLLDWTITFNPLYQIKYQWTPTTGLSCSDCANPIATPAVTTMYYLEASDSYGCLVEDSILIEVIGNLPAPEISCSTTGTNELTASWDAVPGATNYLLSINGNAPISLLGTATNYVLNNVSTNTEFIIETVGGCIGLSDTTTCCLPPMLSITNNIGESCFQNNDGEITINAIGGTLPLEYDLGNALVNNTGVFDDLEGGMYSATVTDDAGCSDVIDFEIITALELVSHFDLVEEISCFGNNDGAVSVVIDGGSFPLTYVWSSLEVDSAATQLVNGWNYVTITDVNNCVKVDSIELVEPEVLSVVLDGIDVNCFGNTDGKVWATPNGGTGIYSYMWSANSGGQMLDTATNLGFGTYFVTVTDENDCTIVDQFTIIEPTEITSNTQMTQAVCNDSGDGTATIVSQGGTGLHTYQWDDPMMQITNTATGLDVGWYHVIITDSNECTTIDSVEVTAPNQIDVQSNVVSTSCFYKNDGQITLNINGGTPMFTMTWFDGVGLDNRIDMPAGIDSVIITDANNCSTVHYFDIPEPDEIVVNIDSLDVSCFNGDDGSATAMVVGGVGAYDYSWNDASNQNTSIATGLIPGNYILEVSDANNCMVTEAVAINNGQEMILSMSKTDITCFGDENGTATVLVESGAVDPISYLWNDLLGQTNATATNLAPGNYIVNVTDGNNCIVMDNITIGEPDVLETTISKLDISCSNEDNGSISVVSNGGTGQHVYLWDNNSSLDNIQNLSLGIYYVTTTDESGCFVIDTIEIETEDPILVVSNVTDVFCNDGSDGQIELNISGGVSPYIVRYNGIIGIATQTGLTAQTYNIEVEDFVGCIYYDTLIVNQPIGMSVVSTVTDITCKGESTGAISLVIDSPNAIATIQWGGPNFSSQSQDISGLIAGDYLLLVTDVNNCIYPTTITVNEPERDMSITETVVDVNCYGSSDGSVLVEIDGGTPSYSVLWQNGSTNVLNDSLAAGSYPVTVTDFRNCTVEGVFDVIQPQAITSTYTTEDVTCFDGGDGRIDIETVGGSSPFAYFLDGELVNFSGSVLGIGAGDYVLTLQDNNDCIFDIGTATIMQPDELIIELGTDVVIDLEQSTTINSVVPNGETIVLYEWSVYNEFLSNETSITVEPEFTTIYFLKVTDEFGCVAEDFVTVIVDKERQVYIPLGFSPNDDGNNDQLLTHGKPGTIINDFKVFDKWGELVFARDNFMVNDVLGWDGSFKGQMLPPGVYVWHMDVTYIDGLNEQYKGQTTLIR